MTLAKLPIGIQDFGELIRGGYAYVDKTAYLYRILTEGKPYFLSRPRRFGKSLLISTFEAIFLAKRELFKGLWIDQSDWEWPVHPVIRLDMSTVPNRSLNDFENGLSDQLISIAKHYQIELQEDARPPQTLLFNLLTKLSEKHGNVVVLVDEYDKPLIDQLDNADLAVALRETLKSFYGILKSQDANLKFVFLTGVTKFSKVSVFSGLNNLNDLTMLDNYSALLGYTRDELERYFSDNIEALAEENNLAISDCYENIREWYNGYQFSTRGEKVYNPFSVLRLLQSKKFEGHWFETGTPTFLIKLIESREVDMLDLEQFEVGASDFSTFDIEDLPTLPLLYQTGYITIKSYDPLLSAYRLDYPNREVSEAFSQSLLKHFSEGKTASADYLNQICRNLLAEKWDEKQFFAILESLLGLIPYDLYIKKERHFQSLFYLIFKLAGTKINAEVHTQRGRVDAVMGLENKIIIFEFKLNESPEAALKQIEERAYYQHYADRHLPIYLVGINFNGETRTMDGYLVKMLNQQ